MTVSVDARAEALQQPDWPDHGRLEAVLRSLKSMPPLVFAGECDQLKERLAAVARGEAFLLQGGDCAETFAGTTAGSIRGKLQTLLQMAVVLTYAASVPVVKVGRMAGQFAKPRSAATEVRDGVELPVYRGDAVNRIEFTAAARTADPGRLLEAYHCSSVTLNLCRAFAGGGFADLGQVHAWNQDFVAGSPAGQRYERLAREIDRAIAFMHACGADPEQFRTVEFYSSHEALLLDYELALTRTDPPSGLDYDLSAHLLWIGERTRQPGGPHVEFARRIRNPVAVKIGPAASAQEVLALIAALDPDREPGRLTLITRMGARRIRQALPPLIEAVAASGAQVVWACDPMHGNTVEATSGQKTRYFDDVLDEVAGFFQVHRAAGSHPGGIHIEFTGEDVTECVGGGQHIAESDLRHRYETACDPRLNRSQSLDLAFRVADMYHHPQAQGEPVPAGPTDAGGPAPRQLDLAMRVFLETERLVLRRFTTADVDNLVDLDADPDVMRFVSGGAPTSRGEIENEVLPALLGYYERYREYGFWAAVEKSTGDFLGWFHFRPRQGTAPGQVELGYRLRKSAWGKGYATEGSRALIRRGFTESGVQRVTAEAMAANKASRRVMEKAGLTLVRTFRQPWPGAIGGPEIDVVEYALHKADWEQQDQSTQLTPEH